MQTENPPQLLLSITVCSDEADLVSNIQSFSISGKANIGLLGAVGPDESVDLCGIDIIKLLDSILNLPLIGLDVNQEDKCVVLLNLFHGGLRVQRLSQDTILIHTGSVGNGLADILWFTGKF